MGTLDARARALRLEIIADEIEMGLREGDAADVAALRERAAALRTTH